MAGLSGSYDFKAGTIMYVTSIAIFLISTFKGLREFQKRDIV